MIDVATAGQLLDFGARIGQGQRRRSNLKARSRSTMCCNHSTSPTLPMKWGWERRMSALGAMALFRHFQPDFRVLIIAPRENIQMKWVKELNNFVEHNVRFPDMRVKSLDGRPVKPLVACGNLLELIHEVTVDSNRDFFTRLTSFSLPLTGAMPLTLTMPAGTVTACAAICLG